MDKPSLPKGTRDFGPAVMAKRHFILNTIRSVFEKFGFQPLETPAMENLSTLTGKYGDEGDQLLFRILNSGDFLKDADQQALLKKDSRSVVSSIAEKGLRYDLTVPFARYVVMNRHEIAFPFKRYQMQPVWRADRPQKGRYREFYQCDADVVGTNSLICEAEIILMIDEVMTNLGFTDFTIKINHRGVLNGVAELIGARGRESDLFVAIDKLEKIGDDKVREELKSKGFDDKSLDALFSVLSITGTNEDKLSSLRSKYETVESGLKGVTDLLQVFSYLKTYGYNGTAVELDVALARGLSYYTGCIFEVKINNVSIGSVSGGGRYDNLTSTFGDKDNLSGTGFSFGVDRLFDAMEELNLFPASAKVSTQLLICHLDQQGRDVGLRALSTLRNRGIACEVYPDVSKIRKQLDYANKKMIPYTIVIGDEEIKSGLFAFKNMQTGDQETISLDNIISKLQH